MISKYFEFYSLFCIRSSAISSSYRAAALSGARTDPGKTSQRGFLLDMMEMTMMNTQTQIQAFGPLRRLFDNAIALSLLVYGGAVVLQVLA